jgi:hypothetical protein
MKFGRRSVRVGWTRLLWQFEVWLMRVNVLSSFTAGQAGVEHLNWRFPFDRFYFMDYFVNVSRRIDCCIPSLSSSSRQQTLAALGLCDLFHGIPYIM